MDRREFFKRTGTALATGVLLGRKPLPMKPKDM